MSKITFDVEAAVKAWPDYWQKQALAHKNSADSLRAMLTAFAASARVEGGHTHDADAAFNSYPAWLKRTENEAGARSQEDIDEQARESLKEKDAEIERLRTTPSQREIGMLKNTNAELVVERDAARARAEQLREHNELLINEIRQGNVPKADRERRRVNTVNTKHRTPEQQTAHVRALLAAVARGQNLVKAINAACLGAGIPAAAADAIVAAIDAYEADAAGWRFCPYCGERTKVERQPRGAQARTGG